ncbi:tetratricopeptide repeat protein [Desulfomarina sp.]
MKYEQQVQLEEALRNLPEQQPPTDLHDKIMDCLVHEKKSWCVGFFENGAALFKDSFSPLSVAFAGICLILAFYGGLKVGQTDGEVKNANVMSVPAKMNSEAYLYLAKSLLAAGEPQKALGILRRAGGMKSNPEYRYWQGMVYYTLGDFEKERESYQQLLRKRPDYLPARLNLAHNYLESRQLEKAEELYEQVLRIDPRQERARYNRALVLHLQGRVDEEIGAWKDFLVHFRKGSLAFQAVRHLHERGDYSWRTYRIGYRAVILNQDDLLGENMAKKKREIDYLFHQLGGQSLAELNIVVFFGGDDRRARKLSLDIKTMLAARLAAGNRKEIVRGSWFGEPEAVKKEDGTTVQLSKGILIFGVVRPREKMEERV